jgi:hypothetical protein
VINVYNPKVKFDLAGWLKVQKQKYMYLVVGPGELFKQRLADLVNIPADEQFQGTVDGMVTAYLENGEMPPEQIAPTILNLADDVMAGREMVIRAGDYIALRNYMRAKAE